MRFINVSKSESLLNNVLHMTSKNGKISKRKQEKSNRKSQNYGLIQCFNLAEKEKFQQLISQNICALNKNALSNVNNKNLYQNLIRSSPTKIRDDLSDWKKSQNLKKTEVSLDKYILSNNSILTSNKVSKCYTRRISLNTEAETNETFTCFDFKQNQNNKTSEVANHSRSNIKKFYSKKVREEGVNEKKSDNDDDSNSIIEIKEIKTSKPIDYNNKKVAQKRHPSINLNDNDHLTSMEMAKLEKNVVNLSTFQNLNKVNRALTDLEKKLNEKLSKNTSILEGIFKPNSTAFLIEEERYKFKKRQRLERERIEKELAAKFSQQLKLDSSLVSSIYLDEQEKVDLEDEFPELSEEQEIKVNSALVHTPPDEVLINGFGAGITRKDIQTLKGLNWLNDEIINFYMNLICERSQKDKSMRKCYAFTTFFYPKLLKDGYNSLKRWTRKIDIFSYDLILVPIHLGLHWTLAAVDFTCNEIRYYDSMNGYNNECLKAIRNYLKDEYADKKSGAQFDLSKWNCIHVRDVPQQMNGSDCGMFTCKYAEFLSRGKNVFNFNQSHMPYFRRRMIYEIINKKLL